MQARGIVLLNDEACHGGFFAFAALGFGLFTVPVVGNIFLEEQYDLGSFGRGAVGTGMSMLLASLICSLAGHLSAG